MATIQDLGKVAYLNKGVYNSETTYEINDVVSFNGSSYVSKTNENRGNLPTNTIYWSIVASKGDKGETGKPFVIEKTYMTIEAMVADYDNMNINDYVMISGNIEEEQNATLWTKTANEVSPYKWEYLADFSGASGITGATPNIIIGNVTEGNQPAVTRRAGSSNENPILDFILKTGPKGDIGDTGNGISSIEKTGTSGLVDTYTITYTDGTTSTFQVTNGEDAEITPEEFEELQNEVNELKDENQRLKATLPTTTGTGENITLDKTAEMDFVIPPLPEGNTSQDTTEGYQLLPITDISSFLTEGMNIRITDKILYMQGTSTKGMNITVSVTNVHLIANEAYTIVTFVEGTTNATGTAISTLIGNSTQTNIITIRNQIGTNILNYTPTKDTDLTKINAYVSSKNLTCDIKVKLMIVEGTYTSSTIPAWEPYTNGASPNPEYEQEVQVVKGDVEVKVQNKNLLDKENEISQGSTRDSLDTTRVSIRVKHKLKANTTYTVITNLNTGNFLWAFVLGTKVSPWSDAEQLYDTGWKNTNYWSYTTSQECYINIPIRNSSNTNININDVKDYWVMLYEGAYDSSISYEPHQGKELPLDLPVENLLNVNEFTSTSSARIVGNATSGQTINGIPINAGTYTASFDIITLPTVDYRIQFFCSSDNIQTQGATSPTNVINDVVEHFTTLGRYSVTITTTQSGYLYLRCVPSGFVLDNIQIEPGLKANHYTPFGTTPIELCKIGDYKNYFYKDNGKWYLHKRIEKIVLDGSENWDSVSSYIYALARQSIKTHLANSVCFSDMYIYISDINVGTYGIRIGNAQFIQIRNTDINNVNDFKTWLSTHNTSVYYILQEPVLIEITDTTLISQLEAIYNAISYYEQTNISGTSSGINPLFDVEAYQSTKLLLENALDRLELLES